MSRATWSFGLMLVAACTAPPRPAEEVPPPAPGTYLHVEFEVPDPDAAALADTAVPLVESALTRVPAVTALATRVEDGRAEVVATLGAPVAIAVANDALVQNLSREVAGSVFTGMSEALPALVLALPLDYPHVPPMLEATEGVARVEVCGGSERVVAVDLERAKLQNVPLDRVIRAVDIAVSGHDPERTMVDRLIDQGLPDTPGRLSPLAVIRETRRPRPCLAHTARGPVLLLSVFARAGADRARVAADARAAARMHLEPTENFLIDGLPAESTPELAVLDLELAPRDDAPAALTGCLDTAGLPPWALTFPAAPAGQGRAESPSSGAPLRARMFLAVTPASAIEPVRKTLSLCSGVERTAVLAPAADADLAASVQIFGVDPARLAAVADLAAGRLAAVPGVTGLRVLAPRERPVLRLDRDALAARGVALADAHQALRLAQGPIRFGPFGRIRTGLFVVIDLPDRTGTFDHDLQDMYVRGAGGPVPLADLVRTDAAWVPLHRLDRRPAAALDLRLRRAADREAVQRALADVPLPAGVSLELGPGLPAFDDFAVLDRGLASIAAFTD